MPKAKKAEQGDAPDDAMAEVRIQKARVQKLEDYIEELQDRIKEAEDREAASDVEFIRDQLDTLAVDVDSSSAPTTSEEWRRCLTGMLRGSDWRNGTWR